MKTLIIHPDDRSTDFLKPIYENVTDKTVITGGISKMEVNELIESHDRIMMMGHGSPFGLFSMGRFDLYGSVSSYIIGTSTVPLLREKTDNVFIWCNADQFVNYHGLKGLYSGMFISEVGEAKYCGLPGTPQDIVDESNNTFAKLLGEVIHKTSLINSFEYVKQTYGELAEQNPVALYNNNRLYLKD